jgi:hypothetical protein
MLKADKMSGYPLWGRQPARGVPGLCQGWEEERVRGGSGGGTEVGHDTPNLPGES